MMCELAHGIRGGKDNKKGMDGIGVHRGVGNEWWVVDNNNKGE